MKKKIHVETALQRLIRLTPFRNKHRRRELLIQKRPHVLPQADRTPALLVMFDQRARHIYPEPVAARLQPESHHVLHSFPCGNRAGRIHGLLPFLLWIRFIKPIVQRRLVGKEIHRAGTVPVRNAPDTAHAAGLFPDTVRPDITICVVVFLRLHGLPKPFVGYRRMAGHQIKQHMHVPLMRFFE